MNLSQQFFDATVENCRYIIDQIKPTRTRFTIEMMGWNLPDGPDSYLRLIQGRRPQSLRGPHGRLQRHQLPAAFLREHRLYPRMLRETRALDRVLPREGSGVDSRDERALRGSRARKGKVDYATYLREVSKLPVDAPLMLEHLKTAEEYAGAAEHIRKVAAEAGVTFAYSDSPLRFSGG